MDNIKYIVVGLYFLFMVIVGFLFKRLNKDENDYFRSGCQGTWWMVGMSLFMSSISTQTFVANAGVAYEAGFSILFIYLANSVCYLIMFLGVAAWYRQARVTTFAEIVYDRFGLGFQQFFSYISMITLVLYAGLGLYMLSLFANTVFGFPLVTLIIAIGFIVLIYTLAGGNWAVLAGDFLQSLIMVPMILLMAFLALKEIGGIGSFFSAINASEEISRDFAIVTKGRQDGLYGGYWLLGNGLVQVFIILGMGGGHRFFACKDGKEARKAALFCMVVSTVCALVYFIPPMVARLLHSESVMQTGLTAPQDISYAYMSKLLLPNGLLPLMTVAMFAAQISSLDTALNANSAMFIKNIYPEIMRLFGKKPSQDHKFLLKLGRLFTLFFGLMVIVFGVYFAKNAGEKGIFETAFRVTGTLTLPLFIPLFMGFFIPKTPQWSGCLSSVCGLCGSVVSLRLGFSTHILALVVSASSSSAFVFSIVFWKGYNSSKKELISRLFSRIHRPVEFSDEIGQDNDSVLFKVLGILAFALGSMLWFFILFPNTLENKLYIILVAGFVQIIGLLLMLMRKLLKSN
ncbi:Na(+)/glucose symporter [Limihaloglobus sulfuriphilus]|uniref:Na(+)/glucose symporter n=1 Tax=Limihaloglobus sulfuriphilus TaxID=1851148 RepID=A0A1Q2ME24_9BACT|nr:hypothetical protein [Limihaloglobus sulfuriphilus]AQQ70945.1 Na(+)/glucose symporter [Limihaloglobus sulfuriphilus]